MDNKRLLLGGLGVAIVVGFFLPWIDVGGALTVSGWQMVKAHEVSLLTRGALALAPILGALLAISGFSGKREARGMALVAGGSILGYTFYKLAWGFLKTTGVGLWMILAAAVVAVIVSLSGEKKSA